MLDLRTGEELIPGESCMPLPLCPVENDSVTLLDIRAGEELIPGVDCQPLPECPDDGIDVIGEAFIPGLTCQIKKGTSNSNSLDENLDDLEGTTEYFVPDVPDSIVFEDSPTLISNGDFDYDDITAPSDSPIVEAIETTSEGNMLYF